MGRGKAQKSLDLIETAHDILAEIAPASFRAVCYQLFNRGLIDSMEKANTNRISGLLTAAWEDGTIPWEWIVQEGRSIEQVSTWRDPAAFARTVMGTYREDKWEAQPRHVMVISEKGTVRGSLKPVLDAFEVDFFPVGGFNSSTRVHEQAQSVSPDHPLLLLYLGDYDPSGMGMSTQDLPRRFASYADDADAPTREEARDWTDDEVAYYLGKLGLEFRRVALLEDDGRLLGRRLGFPAAEKQRDTHYQWFVDHYGDDCWELDALSPVELRARVEYSVRVEIEPVAWNRYVQAERMERKFIEPTLARWNGISGLASEYETQP
jgi:hypothetical protein